jgi:hypothetical protein
MNEYRRFGDIFFKHWGDGGMQARPGQPGRKLISSLPGNHDLGFARGVQEGVRDRFEAYFGDGNRIDVIANHTFVSIDSVSLSALGQESPEQVEKIWRPTKEFLEDAKKRKKRLIQRELRAQQGLRPYPGMPHVVVEKKDLATSELPHANDEITEFPTILLTHVPLYRAPGTPCGPLREHWPPTPPPAGQPPLEHDDRNAISVRGGYQYQNVLNREITADVAEKIGDIRYAFSGDDHDYCELLHKAYTSAGGGIREITVKSISWAMGVRLPGVVLVSLWNPVDAHGKPTNGGDASKTVQTKLCLLPDQIGTFLKYGTLFGLTLALLFLRAAMVMLGFISTTGDETRGIHPLLPTTNAPSPSFSAAAGIAEKDSHSSNSSTSSERNGNLSVRTTTQSRITQQQHQHQQQHTKYKLPLIQHAGYDATKDHDHDYNYHADNDDDDDDDTRDKKVRVYGVSTKAFKQKKHGKRRTGFRLFWWELGTSLRTVVVCGGLWYAVLVWRG